MRCPPRIGDGLGYGVFSEAGLVAQAWKSFALIALRLPKVCDRSHKNLHRSLGGPLPAWQRLSFNPARPFTAVLAGECPLYARAIVILFLAALGKRGNFPYLLPLLQFTKRRIRTFITIPSARNINRTEDPP
jgi:hypothetical protein